MLWKLERTQLTVALDLRKKIEVTRIELSIEERGEKKQKKKAIWLLRY